MMSQVFRSIWLAVAIAISGSAVMFARAEDDEKDLPALAAAIKDTKVKLEDGLKASEREGKPISAKFEIDDGKLQLSVYTMKGDGFAEVAIDPKTGAIKAEKITDAEDSKRRPHRKPRWKRPRFLCSPRPRRRSRPTSDTKLSASCRK